jgi:hypothetical protein
VNEQDRQDSQIIRLLQIWEKKANALMASIDGLTVAALTVAWLHYYAIGTGVIETVLLSWLCALLVRFSTVFSVRLWVWALGYAWPPYA